MKLPIPAAGEIQLSSTEGKTPAFSTDEVQRLLHLNRGLPGSVVYDLNAGPTFCVTLGIILRESLFPILDRFEPEQWHAAQENFGCVSVVEPHAAALKAGLPKPDQFNGMLAVFAIKETNGKVR